MSASLVGSEMCIRDSGSTQPRGPHPRVLRRPRGGLPPHCLLRARACPVSYTHLTLPTICSV
eukprot:3948815-Alexandrium_andersonii.AAC.1